MQTVLNQALLYDYTCFCSYCLVYIDVNDIQLFHQRSYVCSHHIVSGSKEVIISCFQTVWLGSLSSQRKEHHLWEVHRNEHWASKIRTNSKWKSQALGLVFNSMSLTVPQAYLQAFASPSRLLSNTQHVCGLRGNNTTFTVNRGDLFNTWSTSYCLAEGFIQ